MLSVIVKVQLCMHIYGYYYRFEYMFKKSKNGWIQEFFSGLLSSPVLTRPIENTQRIWKNDIVRFERMGTERILHPPDLAFRLDAKLILRLKERLQRTRRPLQGMLVGDSLDSPITSFLETVEQDLGAVQEADGVFCVGVVLTKGEGDPELTRRIAADLRRCSERNSAIYGNSKRSGLSQLNRTTIRQLRSFLILDQSREGLSVGRLMYFPNVNIPFRKVKITPSSLAVNDMLNHIKNELNFSKDATFGYISLIGGDRHKFVLIDRNDPQLQANPPPVLGVWAAGNLGSSVKRDESIWSLLMEYLTDPHLTKRLSVDGERNGLFFSFENPVSRDKSLVPYVFEFPSNARWAINTRFQSVSKIPEQYCFTQQEVIMQEQREESQAESMSSKREEVNDGMADNGTLAVAKAIQEKDTEIRRLRVEVQFYKNQCEKLQEELNNLKVQQLAQKNIALNSTPIFPQEPISDGPYFGRHFDDDQTENKAKSFIIRDMKNISFAQENSFQQEIPSNSIVERPIQYKFATPEFKEGKDSKPVQLKDVKAFNFGRENMVKEIPQKEKVKTKQQTITEKEVNFNEGKQKGLEGRTTESEKEQKIQKDINPTTIQTLQAKYDRYNKYDNYKVYSKGSPPIKIFQERKASQSEKNTPKKEEPPRRAAYQEEPREKRIKNELYSQEKDSRSKSPFQKPKEGKSIDSDDEDAQLKKIIQKRRNKQTK